jgi:hypothetical protein
MDRIFIGKNKWKDSETQYDNATDELEGKHDTFSFCSPLRHKGAEGLKDLGNLSDCGQDGKVEGCCIQHNRKLRQKR